MSGPNIATLPPELHLKIHSYLTTFDSVVLGLSCRKLYAARSCQPLLKFPANCFWKMISLNSTEDFVLQHQMLAQWDTLLEDLPRLRQWTERVMGDTAMRALQDKDTNIIDYRVTWYVCVGCACYKVETDDWKEGWDFIDVLCRNVDLAEWFELEWDVLDHRFKTGSFCKTCCQEWEKLKAS